MNRAIPASGASMQRWCCGRRTCAFVETQFSIGFIPASNFEWVTNFQDFTTIKVEQNSEP